jgi:DNA-binding NarL/FixJ family response regulator
VTSLRVLIVDDAAALRRAVGALLAEAGHEVVGEAADGRAGVAMTLARSPDLVIIDWQMPRLDGVEAVRRIHAGCPGMHVIAFSWSSDPAVRDGFLEAGAYAYHDKADIAGLEASIAQIAALVSRRR